MTATPTLLLRDFDPHNPADQPAFQRLNEEWIKLHFTLEPKDIAALLNPEQAYLAPGGRIFLALEDDQPLGCCALIRMAPTEYEVSKMAVTQTAQGKGLGRRLLAHTIAEARKSGATRLFLETNHVLLPAIHLYESLGFKPVPPERLTPSPYARADVHMELFLT
jgi:putative acetyltransferase